MRKSALGALQEPTANEDGSISPAMLRHYTNHHPLTGSRLESHQVLTSVLENLMGTVHETETSIQWPTKQGGALSRQFLAVVDDANEQLEPEQDVDEDSCYLKMLGAYCRADVPVRMFQIRLCFARSWQERTGIYDFDGIAEETILVDSEGLRLDTLPHAFSFYIDAIDDVAAVDDDWDLPVHGRVRDEGVNIGRSVMERLLEQGMRAKGQDFGGDAAWLDEREDRMAGIRIWGEDEMGERRLLLLGRPSMGLVYVGDLAG